MCGGGVSVRSGLDSGGDDAGSRRGPNSVCGEGGGHLPREDRTVWGKLGSGTQSGVASFQNCQAKGKKFCGLKHTLILLG